MPRIALTKEQAIVAKHKLISEQCDMACTRERIKYKDIAAITGVTSSAIGKQFQNKRITLDTYLAVQMLVEEKM